MLNFARHDVGCASGDTDVYAVAVSASCEHILRPRNRFVVTVGRYNKWRLNQSIKNKLMIS